MQMKLGDLGDAIYAKTQEIARANEVVKKLEFERKQLEDTLLSRMQEVGTDIARGNAATVSISEIVRPQLQDWDALEKYVYRQKALYLFERRISSTAYRELKASLPKNKGIPGLSEFVQLRLNVRKL